MADNMINLAGNQLPPDIARQQAEATRQQQLAQLLTQQGTQSLPTGSMVSGRFVPTSPFQYLAQYGNIAAGNYLSGKASEEAQKTAQALRQYYADELKTFAEKRKINPEEAYMFGATAYNPAIATTSMKKLTEGPNWAEVSQYNPKTGNTETFVYDKNSPDPQSTMRFVSVSKPALDPYQQLKLGDEGIGTGRFGGGQVGNAPVVGGGNVPTVNNPPVVGNTAPLGGTVVKPAGTVAKPVSATNVNEDALVKTYGYDPFKPPPMPAMPSGSKARDWKANLYKELEGTPANTVTGATTYVDALEKYKNYVDKLNTRDLANPQVRNQLNSLYAQVKLTGKEANNLGVLNGGDEKILEAVVPNYSDILVTKKTVQKILDEQKEFGSSKIVATYRTAQKPVPENMRKYIVVPKIAEEAPTGTPKQTGATAKAILNGKTIEVRNGKWVYSDNGMEVK